MLLCQPSVMMQEQCVLQSFPPVVKLSPSSQGTCAAASKSLPCCALWRDTRLCCLQLTVIASGATILEEPHALLLLDVQAASRQACGCAA